MQRHLLGPVHVRNLLKIGASKATKGAAELIKQTYNIYGPREGRRGLLTDTFWRTRVCIQGNLKEAQAQYPLADLKSPCT